MGGLSWVELHTTLPDHPKSIRLGIALNDPRAWTYLAELMLWCAKCCPAGRVDGPDAALVLERGAGWRGEPGRFAEAATAIGFFDRDENGVSYHGWAERAAAHLAKLDRDASRQKTRYERISARFKEKPKTKTSRGERAENARRNDGESAEKKDSPQFLSGNSNPNPNPNPNPLPTEASLSPPPGPASDGALRLTAAGLREAADRRDPDSPGTAIRAEDHRAPLVYEKPTTPPDGWLFPEFFRWAQHVRHINGYIVEKWPKGHAGRDWYASAIGTPGVTVPRLKEGFYAYGDDPYWKQRNCPFNGFMDQWPRFMPPEVAHAS